jgi:hypothetical protein
MAPKTHPNDDPTKTDTVTQSQDLASATQTDSAPTADQEEAGASPS